MSISLQKGQKVSLSKENAGLSTVLVGLGWDEVEQKRGFLGLKAQQDIDCDASAILLKEGKLRNNGDLVYFGEGDDEQILMDLSKIPPEYDRIVIVVNIYDAVRRRQQFGMIRNAFIRLVDGRNNREMCKYNLTEDYSGMTAMIFGEIYRYNGEWKFSAIGQGPNDPSLGDLCKRYV